MKFQYFSDLHSEYHKDNLINILPTEKLLKKEEGIVILAGDILSFKNKINETKALDYLTEQNRVFYIPGNHEFYGTDVEFMFKTIKEYTRIFELEDAIIFLTPLWSYLNDKVIHYVEEGVSDFRLIKGHSGKTHNEMYVYCKDFLDNGLASFVNDPRKKIVVTHFTPSHKSIHPQWYGSKLNTYFSNDLDDMILKYQPNVWIHGHTHDAFDYTIGNTRVLCNPHGYPFEYNSTKKFHFNVVEI